MKKLIIIPAFLVLFGCNNIPSDEVTYTRNNQGMTLAITHRNNGNSCTIIIKNAEDAKKYKEKLQRLMKEVEDFEKELSIREKNN